MIISPYLIDRTDTIAREYLRLVERKVRTTKIHIYSDYVFGNAVIRPRDTVNDSNNGQVSSYLRPSR